MEKILIYGINRQAQSLYKMITAEQAAEVMGFLADDDYIRSEILCDMPVISTSKLSALYSAKEYSICLSFGYKNMVHNRKEKFDFCKSLGYSIFSFISKNAVIYTSDIGEGCNIYPGTILAPNVSIGKGCFIEMGSIIAHDTKIGDFNFIAPGVHFCGGITTEEHCFFGSSFEIMKKMFK